MRALTTVVLLSALIVAPTVAADDAPVEDFSAFLARFAMDGAFRNERIELPLQTIRGNPTDPRVKEKWSLAQVQERLTPPVPRNELDARGLEEKVTYPMRAEAEVRQSQRASDSYILIYRFKLRRGQWRLVSYEDSSY